MQLRDRNIRSASMRIAASLQEKPTNFYNMKIITLIVSILYDYMAL